LAPLTDKTGVGSTAFWQYGLAVKLKFATGSAVIVTEAVALTAGHPAAAGIVFVIRNPPAVLFDKLITPVDVLRFRNTEEALNTPAVPPPVNAGTGFVPLLQ
jgi:hypothetical protein